MLIQKHNCLFNKLKPGKEISFFLSYVKPVEKKLRIRSEIIARRENRRAAEYNLSERKNSFIRNNRRHTNIQLIFPNSAERERES